MIANLQPSCILLLFTSCFFKNDTSFSGTNRRLIDCSIYSIIILNHRIVQKILAARFLRIYMSSLTRSRNVYNSFQVKVHYILNPCFSGNPGTFCYEFINLYPTPFYQVASIVSNTFLEGIC